MNRYIPVAERQQPTEYERKVEKAFERAPFRCEFRSYNGQSSKPGVWNMLHQSNGAIIASGDTPEQAIASLIHMAERMDDIRRGLPFQERKAQA